jgi:hypothetical protein
VDSRERKQHRWSTTIGRNFQWNLLLSNFNCYSTLILCLFNSNFTMIMFTSFFLQIHLYLFGYVR